MKTKCGDHCRREHLGPPPYTDKDPRVVADRYRDVGCQRLFSHWCSPFFETPCRFDRCSPCEVPRPSPGRVSGERSERSLDAAERDLKIL